MAGKLVTGVDLHFEEGGGGTPTLLLLHGLGANGDVWAGLKPILREQWRGRWVIPDLRGHGRSGHRAPYSYAGHAADVAALLTQDEEVIVVGHSMGGMVALALATGWYGLRVSHACVFGIKIKWTADEVTKLRQMTQVPVRWFESQDDAVTRYLKVSGLFGLIDPASPAALSGIREEGGRFRLATDPMINAVIGPTVDEFMAAAKAPIRLAAGADDPMVTLADMRGLCPEAVLFESAGHNPHIEQPKVLWDFIRRAIA